MQTNQPKEGWEGDYEFGLNIQQGGSSAEREFVAQKIADKLASARHQTEQRVAREILEETERRREVAQLFVPDIRGKEEKVALAMIAENTGENKALTNLFLWIKSRYNINE